MSQKWLTKSEVKSTRVKGDFPKSCSTLEPLIYLSLQSGKTSDQNQNEMGYHK